MAALQIWRHRPSGNHYAAYVEDREVVRALGPMTPKEAADLTIRGFSDADSKPAVVDSLNAAPWEYDPVWQDTGHGEEDAEWLKAVMEPADDSTL